MRRIVLATAATLSLHCSGSDVAPDTSLADEESISVFGHDVSCKRLESTPKDATTPLAFLDVQKEASVPVLAHSTESQGIYRGGYPNGSQLNYLKQIGVRTILTLESGATQSRFFQDPFGKVFGFVEEWCSGNKSLERTNCKRDGLEFFDFGFNPVAESAKSQDALVDKALSILADESRRPVYVHCSLGIDRTGLVLALHRVVNEHWDAERAFHEWKDAGFRDRCDSFKTLVTGFNRKVKSLGDNFQIATSKACRDQ